MKFKKMIIILSILIIPMLSIEAFASSPVFTVDFSKYTTKINSVSTTASQSSQGTAASKTTASQTTSKNDSSTTVNSTTTSSTSGTQTTSGNSTTAKSTALISSNTQKSNSLDKKGIIIIVCVVLLFVGVSIMAFRNSKKIEK